MADDHTQRPYRASEAPTRGAAAGTPPGNDPLAELARLIGQNDPFGEFGRDGTRRAAAPRQPDPAPEWPAEREAVQPAPAAPHSDAPLYGSQEFGRQPYGGASLSAGADLYQVEGHAPGYGVPGYEVPGYPAAPAATAYEQTPFPPGNDPFAQEEDDYYDDAPPNRRRIGILAIAAVFALAVIGTAGAFGYRAIFGSSSTTKPPPVIKAETAPSKIVPASASKDVQSGKMITDRINDRGQGEKLVSREEQPIAVTSQRPVNVVFPPAQGPNGLSAPQVGSGVVGSEPKRIRTIAIHPDQPSGGAPEAASPQDLAPQQARTVPVAPPARPAAPAQPMRITNAPPVVAAAEPAPRAAPVRQVTAPPPANAPLSLDPNAAPARAAAPAPRRTAAAAAAAAAPTSLAAAPSSGGGYAVQVSSQRSEADAQTAFNALQGKYPSQLGGRQPLIKRVDLGAKGIYYRAMVGPFGSSGEAGELCSSLKSAGGSCLVQRN